VSWFARLEKIYPQMSQKDADVKTEKATICECKRRWTQSILNYYREHFILNTLEPNDSGIAGSQAF
jgi:hypothetical protein